MSDLQANPIGSEHFLGDSRIRFELYSDPNNTDDEHGGIWYWDNQPSSFPYDNVINIIADADGGGEVVGSVTGAGTTFCYVTNWHRKAKLDVDNPFETVAVILTNNALLTGGRTAIQDGRRSASWNQDYYGGLVIAENANFINCSRGAAFMRYVYEQKSRFVNCEFIEEDNEVEGSAGVTIWNSYDISFENCFFEGMDRYAIHGIDYGALITGNTFRDNRKGVDILNSFPLSGSEIVIGSNDDAIPKNQFLNNQTNASIPSDVHAESASLLGGLTIRNNQFSGSALSVAVVGESSFVMQRNTFDDSFLGLGIASTGTNPFNEIACNTLSDFAFFGMRMSGDNPRLEILGNQLQALDLNWGRAIGIFDNSSIDFFQGEDPVILRIIALNRLLRPFEYLPALLALGIMRLIRLRQTLLANWYLAGVGISRSFRPLTIKIIVKN